MLVDRRPCSSRPVLPESASLQVLAREMVRRKEKRRRGAECGGQVGERREDAVDVEAKGLAVIARQFRGASLVRLPPRRSRDRRPRLASSVRA